MTSSRQSAPSRPRIALIHALEQSILPSRQAFAACWPQAHCFDLLDTSLSADLAYQGGRLDATMMRRFEVLADYARGTAGEGGTAAAILFTCSAFGPAIDAVKARLDVPVLRPNEAAFEDALSLGSRIGLVVTYGPSLSSLAGELEAMAVAAGRAVTVTGHLAAGALEALAAGDGELHDRLIAQGAARLEGVDAIVLGQFSAARACAAAQAACGVPVLTTPGAAVMRLRRLVLGEG